MSEDRSDTDDVAGRLSRAVGQIARRIRPSIGELSMGHFSTLASIQRAGGSRPSDLARVERVSAPTMARILATLEGRGLIERQQSRDDARSVMIGLTAGGAAIVRQTRQERALTVAELLQHLSADQLTRLTDALAAIEQIADAAATPDEAAPPR